MISKQQRAVAAFGKKVISYEAHAMVQDDAADWLAQWLPDGQDCHNCLELGAGTGLFTRHLVGRYPHIEASDIEPAMVALCREKYPAVAHNLRDAWTTQHDAGLWDLVTASSLLQWASKPTEAMQHWRKLIKPNGRILVGFFIEPSLPEMQAVTGTESPLVWRDADRWREIFHAAGLVPVRMESESKRYHYPSALDFWKSIHSTGTAVSRRISPSQMMRFFRDYELQFRDAEGVYATWTFCRAELKPDS
jgi:malonyl-CoA O-methyltransferase